MPTLKPRTAGRHHSEPRVLIQDVIPRATHLALTALAGGGFALAGSGAIREHGIIDRPTQDIDLFTSVTSGEAFAASTTRLAAAMSEAGLEIVVRRSPAQFATSPSRHRPAKPSKWNSASTGAQPNRSHCPSDRS
jgi:hypothetical protein